MKAPNFYLADLHLWPPAPASRKGNLVCSEKVQFAPQSRNCEVEGELARDKTSSIFTVEEKVAVFERGEIDLSRNSTMMSIVLVITHS